MNFARNFEDMAVSAFTGMYDRFTLTVFALLTNARESLDFQENAILSYC